MLVNRLNETEDIHEEVKVEKEDNPEFASYQFYGDSDEEIEELESRRVPYDEGITFVSAF